MTSQWENETLVPATKMKLVLGAPNHVTDKAEKGPLEYRCSRVSQLTQSYNRLSGPHNFLLVFSCLETYKEDKRTKTTHKILILAKIWTLSCNLIISTVYSGSILCVCA